MDFALSEEQSLLKDSADRFVQEAYDFEARRALADGDPGYSPQHWRTFADLGWLALPFPEAVGGLDGTPVETMVLMEAFGRGLVLEPYLSTIVLGGGLIATAGTDGQKSEFLGPLADGSLKVAVAFAEPQSRYDLADVTTRAERDGDGFRLTGAKSVVLHGPMADKLIVSARTAGDRRDERGITLFVLDKAAEGVSSRDYGTLDGSRASDIVLEDVRVDADAVLGDVDGALPAIEQVTDRATAAVCAEAIGAMEALLGATREYLATRQQFGQAIGRFQVLQHRFADMTVEFENAKSLAYVATMKLDAGNPLERVKAVSAAKAQVGKAGRFVGAQAVQLHGGMGVSEELNVGTYFKRLTVIGSLFGDVAFHTRRYGSIVEV